MLPTHHAEHETLELTLAINDWAEVGFYLFSSIQPDGGWQWVVTTFARGCMPLRSGTGLWA
jgi:predicted  nucleic acid-binding Zn ribbon protein